MNPAEANWNEETTWYGEGTPFLPDSREKPREILDISKQNTREQFESEGWTLGEKNFLPKLLNQEFLKDNLHKIVSFATIPDTTNNSIATYIHIGKDIGKIPTSLKQQTEIKRAFQVIVKNGKLELTELTKIGTEWAKPLEEQGLFAGKLGNDGGSIAFARTETMPIPNTEDFSHIITPENINLLNPTPPEEELPFSTGTDE